MAEESGLFPISLVNSDLYTITYTPNIDVTANKFSGNGLGSDGATLEGLSSSALAEYIKGGVVSNPNTTSYWSNDVSGGLEDSWFDITFNKNYIYPVYSGEILLAIRAGKEPVTSNTTVENLELWAKKSLNPSLAADVLVGTGATITLFSPDGALADYNQPLSIIENNRLSWEIGMPGLYLSLSGKLVFFTNATSGIESYNGMEITVSGLLNSTTALPSSGNFDMYTAGHSPSSGNLNLFLPSFLPVNSGIDLYTVGGIRSSGRLDMFTMAGMTQTNFDMYEVGHITSSGRFDLYMRGHLPTTSGFDMYLTGHEDKTNFFYMYLKGPAYGTSLSGTDMVMFGPSNLPYSGILPMVVYQDTSRSASIDMFLQNNAVSGSRSFNMFLKAPSGTYGAVPWSGILPMFIARDSEGIDAGINMYICGPNTQSSGFNMFIDGVNSLSSQFDMSISGGGPVNSSINLFLHGF